MAKTLTQPGTNVRGGFRAALTALAMAIVVGLAAAAVSYLGSSLQVPGPAAPLSVAAMEERGAARYMSFCGNTFEPRFWPECTQGADEWRERGASRLVAFCSRAEPSRLFTAADCESEDRPLAALSVGPRPQDAAVGGVAAVVTLVVLAVVTAARGALRPRAALLGRGSDQ